MPNFLAHRLGRLRLRPDSPAPLGAALVLGDLSELSGQFDLLAFAAANRWVPVAFLGPDRHGVMAGWRRNAPLQGLIELHCDEDQCRRTLAAHLAEDGAPEPREIVQYISTACPSPAFARALLAEMIGDQRSARSTRHAAFRRHGPLTAVDWRGLNTVIRSLVLSCPDRVGDAAMMLDIDPRTLQSHCHRLLDLDWRDARQGFGWKWAVERTLRLHGYVSNDPPVPLAFSTFYPVPRLTHRRRRATAN